MGMSLCRGCSTNYTPPEQAPNPNPGRFEILEVFEFKHAYVLIVKYPDATNFEGVKCMVYTGKFPGKGKIRRLDPHFAEKGVSPIARFRPDATGVWLAKVLASGLKMGGDDGKSG